ncbi:hypothetical protein FKM82_016662 [Ascaphus truei]
MRSRLRALCFTSRAVSLPRACFLRHGLVHNSRAQFSRESLPLPGTATGESARVRTRSGNRRFPRPLGAVKMSSPCFYRQELNKTLWEVPERYQNLTPVGSGAYGSVW